MHVVDQKSYLTFLNAQNAGAFRETRGYFHPTLHAVITHNARMSPKWATLRSRFEPPKARETDAERINRRRLEFLWEERYRAEDLGTAAHEMVHLLVEASGLATEPKQLPSWLHEGLATQFEVVRGGRWAGIGRANDLRLLDWRAVASLPRLGPLIRDNGFGHGYSGALYSQSWALVYFLQRTRPDRFVSLIDRLKTPDRLEDSPDAARFINVFLAAFREGLEVIQADWIRTVTETRTPLEENAPGRGNPLQSFRDQRD